MLTDSVVIRYDNFNFDDVKLKKTSDGYLEGHAIITRVGVFTYINPDGSTRKELRTPEEVFKKDAMDSFKLLPMTDDHPQEIVNSDNYKELSIGYTGEDVKKDGDYLISNLKITHNDSINQILNGKRGLSCGYTTDLVKKDGIHNGESYDYIQTNIRGNHLAIVDMGRAGEMARLKLDKHQGATCFFNNINNYKIMKKIRLDGKDHEVSDEVYSEITTLKNEKEKFKNEVKDLKNKTDTLEGERDALKEALNKSNDSEEVNKKVKARLDLCDKAYKVLKEDVSELTDMEIKLKVIQTSSPSFKVDQKSEEYINGRFDSVIDLKKENNLGENMIITSFKGDSNKSEINLSDEDLQRNLINNSKNIK